MNFKFYSSIFLFLFSSTIFFAQGAETIKIFEVDIKLNENRSIDIEENIQVYALGNKIKRGITRSLPLSKRVEGKQINIDYQDVQIFMDGKKVSFFYEDVNENRIYYVGDKDVFLSPGNYHYTIKYTVPNQIISNKDKAQFLWNAIGTDVIFKTEKAKVTVSFEDGMRLLNSKLYIGKYGSGEDVSRAKEIRQNEQLIYEIYDGLMPNEAVTVDLNLSSGSVAAPSFFQKYSSLLTILLGGIAMFFYFIITWFKFGRDPKHDASALLYDTPENLSPASIQYIHKEKYTSRALTSSFIALALKGYINIAKEGEKGLFSKESYVIGKLKDGSNELPAEQLSIMDNLFRNSTMIYLDGEYNPIVKSARNSHQIAVENQHRDFVKQGNNLKFVLYAILILILVIAASTILANTIEINNYPHLGNLAIFIPISIIGILIYRYLIIQPTVEKLNLQEEIRAFKQYIEMNVVDHEKLVNAPKRDIAHFESLLPYAYALDIESKWSDSFSDLLTKSNYAPRWSGGYYYAGGLHHGLSRSVYSTSTKPQSSSGGGGGGGSFSGGGGGGGGVGGW